MYLVQRCDQGRALRHVSVFFKLMEIEVNFIVIVFYALRTLL